MRIKCPICQSYLVEMLWEDTDSYATIHTKEYECQCGCAFEVNFVAEKNPKILNMPIKE